MYINRGELKRRGSFRFRANYWHAVLVALVYFLLNGGAVTISRRFNTTTTTTNSSFSYNDSYSLADDPTIKWIIGLALGVVLIAVAIGFTFAIFVINPINVGVQTFFLRNSSGEAEGFHLGDGFKYNYLNVVKTMFFMNLWILLWTLLFIVPGIIKSYSYRLVPYILAENPDIDTNEVLRRSEQLMRGNKWETFIYDLSFIGWYILGIFFLVSVFWVQPYKLSCDAELYRLLAGKSGEDYSFGIEGTGTGPSGYEEPSYYAPGFGRNDSAATGEQASSSSPSTSSHSSETKSDGVVSEEDTIEYKPGE